MDTIIKSDKLRFISNIHTTVRQLFICSKIVDILGERQLPFGILKDLIIKWSYQEEQRNETYRLSKGKLTETTVKNKRETTALKNYLILCDSLGLINDNSGFYTNTRLGYLLKNILVEGRIDKDKLSLVEKLFYNYILFNCDADGLLLIFQILKDDTKKQADLQKLFKDDFNKRLNAKQNTDIALTRNLASEKYRTINYVWQNADSYSEHILIPRCEWLRDLGFISIERKGSTTLYSVTKMGCDFYGYLPKVDIENSIKDIDENFIKNHFFSVLCNIKYFPLKDLFVNLSYPDQSLLIGKYLDNAFKVIKTSNNFRLPLTETLIYILLEVITKDEVLINYSDIISMLSNNFSFNQKNYSISDLGRINENYILVQLAV